MFGFSLFIKDVYADINEICLHFPLFPFSSKYGVAVFSPTKSTFSLTSDPYVVSDIFLLPENRWFLRYYQKKRVVYIYLSGWRDSNPHAFRHNILSVTCLPISPHPVKSIQTISVVTFVSSLLDSSLQPLMNEELYQYFYILVSNHFMKLFYNVSQLEMLFVC